MTDYWSDRYYVLCFGGWVATPSPLVLASEFGDLAVEVDPADGSPVAIRRGTRRMPVTVEVEAVVGGSERRGPEGGLEYPGALVCGLAQGTAQAPREQVDLESRTFSIPARLAGDAGDAWDLIWHYTFSEQMPALAIRLDFVRSGAGGPLRNVRVHLRSGIEDPAGWRVQAPGNRLRANLDLADLSYPTTIQTLAGVDGGTGIIALEDPATPMTFFVWPMAQRTYGEMVLAPGPGGIQVEWTTDVAGDPDIGARLTAGPLMVDLVHASFAEVLGRVPAMLADAGITAPADSPEWAGAVNLYEVQIGFGVFRDGYIYEPYPTAQDLLNDLDRIAGLGYNCLQIMPRQPYPSYNVHDFDDVSISWGDEGVLHQIVQGCHDRGIRVIFDILMHGVIDHEALDAAVAAIDAGPFIGRLHETTADITTLERDEMDHITVSWTRHVKDFEPYWRAGSPPRHALVDEHPEWFTRDSAGAITGMYTQAFDLAHPEFQDYFVDKAVSLMQRMNIDGYRLDAPSYNYFMNWAERTRSNASVSMLGCLPLFTKLRRALTAVNPDVFLYTEPSGCLYRQQVDAVYNYDEQWLVRAVLERGAGKAHWIRNARELAEWLEQRDAATPLGSMTAHHVDSHDSFWWPDPGGKWRREQYGVPAVQALMTLFFLSGGPFMTYVGGETGIEDRVRSASSVRREYPFFARGRSDYAGVTSSSDDIYAVVRESGDGSGLLLVNLSPDPVETRIRLDRTGTQAATATTVDLLGGGDARWDADCDAPWVTIIPMEAYQALALDVTGMR